MAYSKEDFRRLRAKLRETLILRDGSPLSCSLHEAEHAHGLLTLILPDGEHMPLHVAEACNIADIVSSVDRILALPRSNVACRDMAEVLLLRLDVLREYIAAAVKRHEGLCYGETEADRVIRRWAGFLKHPSEYVFAHRCLSSWEIAFDPPAIRIDCSFLRGWDALKQSERDLKKTDLAHHVVEVHLPAVEQIEKFLEAASSHLEALIQASSVPNKMAFRPARPTIHLHPVD